MKYPKWRELIVNPFDIPFKNIKLFEIVNYFPAGNDVMEGICDYQGRKHKVIIKIERSKVSDFTVEFNTITKLNTNNYYNKTAQVIEYGVYQNHKYLVLTKVRGKRLSEILLTPDMKRDYLRKYGMELGKIHQIPKNEFNISLKRPINDIPSGDIYHDFDPFIRKYLDYLKENKIEIVNNCFIHGDFHYANILWLNQEVSGVLDFEYSGNGFKEQDIAWALILRPNGRFLDSYEDIMSFLDGYSQYETYDSFALKWCLINGYCHFYLMNKDNLEYKNKVKEILKTIKNIKFRN